MNPNLAEEHLQTIRLLMERSALYRRALAPIMLAAGILGIIVAAIGLRFHVEAAKAFAGKRSVFAAGRARAAEGKRPHVSRLCDRSVDR